MLEMSTRHLRRFAESNCGHVSLKYREKVKNEDIKLGAISIIEDIDI